MRKKILLFTLLSSCASSSQAVTLQEALISSYNHSEDFQIIRSDFLSEIEKFPSALASFMPKITAGITSTDSKTKFKTGKSENNRYDRSLTIEQSLFSGGASVAALKSAQSAFMSSRSNYYNKEQSIFTDKITAYLECVAAKKKHEIAKISVNSNKTQLEAVKEKFKFGESTETEVAAAESALADAEAGEAVAYANYEATKANFLRNFSMEAVNLAMPELPSDLPDSADKLSEIALAAHPSIDQVRHATKSAKAETYSTIAALSPQVAVRFSTGNTNYNPENIASSAANNKSVTSTLSVTVPILARGGAEYSDIRRAKQQTRKLALQLDAQIKAIKAQCRASFEELKAAKIRIVASSEAVRSAEIAYNGTIQEEKLGSKTLIDILNTQERLNRARSNNVDAQKELVLAAYKIKALMGTLTAKSMSLPVQYFEPEQEFKKVKLKIVGF